MNLKLMGRKKGMLRLFDEQGNVLIGTVIHAEPSVIAQIKNVQTDGYSAIQLATGKVKPSKIRNVSKPLAGHYKKAGIEPRNDVMETRVEKDEEFQLGQEIGVEHFSDSVFVDVTGVSKGKGHQGVIKRHGFAGGPASHGSGFHRHGGSCGMRTSPGRCLPGQKKSGRMGGEKVTVQSLKVIKIDPALQLIVVGGSIPGPRGGLVVVSKAMKKVVAKKK